MQNVHGITKEGEGPGKSDINKLWMVERYSPTSRHIWDPG